MDQIQEKSSQRAEIEEKRNTRREGLLRVADLFFNGDIERKKAEQEEKLEHLRKKIEELKGQSLTKLISNLNVNEANKTVEITPEQESEVNEKLQAISNELEEIVTVEDLNVTEREIRKIEAFIKRLQERHKSLGEDNPERIGVKTRIDNLKQQKVMYLIDELYKVNTAIVNNPNIRGRQLYLITKLNEIQQKNEGKSLKEIISEGNFQNDIERELSNFVNEYLQAKRDAEKPKIEGIAKQKQEMRKEKERYRRSAEIHALYEKFKNINFENPNQTYSALELQRLAKKLKEHYVDITTSEDEHIKSLRENIELGNIHTLISTIDTTLENIKNDLKDETETEIRKAKLKAGYQEIHKTLEESEKEESEKPIQQETTSTTDNPKKSIDSVASLLKETDYEAQIDKRIEVTQNIKGMSELVKGFEDFSESHMREYEQMRRMEREGPIKKREAMAKQFLKSRIMEEFADTEKVKRLYGSTYLAEEGTSNNSLMEELKLSLITEAEQLFGLEDSTIVSLSDSEKTNASRLKENLTQQINRYIETQKTSEKIVAQYETDEANSRTKLVDSIKSDLVAATLEAKPDGSTEEEIQTLINELFESDNTKLKTFELVPTPNGMAVVIEPAKLDTLKKLILGKNSALVDSEAFAFTLKNNESFKNLVKTNQGDEWDGKLMFVSADADEYLMMHETQHAIQRQLTSELEKDKLNPMNSAIEEIAIRFSSGEVWREIAFPQDEKTTKTNLSLMGLGYLTSIESIPNEKLTALYNFVEIAKKIVEAEVVEMVDKKITPGEQNIYGEMISEILMSNIDDNGDFDVQAALNELNNRFADILKDQTFTPKGEVIDQDITGELSEQEVINTYKWMSNNPGFTFDLIGMRDIRNAENVVYDYYFDGKIGIEKAGKNVSPIGSILQDIPVVGVPLGESWAYRKGMNVGATEYEVDDTWIPFFRKRNYKTRTRAFGGIWRRMGKLPFPFGWLLGDSSEKVTKFGTSPKKFWNDLPPFGRGWEMILTEFFTGPGKPLGEWFEKKFPGRDMNPIEATRMNSTELWNALTKQIITSDLGEGGIGLKGDQVLRVLSEHPMLSIETSAGQFKEEYSRRNLDVIDETGYHKGAIKKDMIDGLKDDKIDSPDSQFKPKDGRKYGAVKNESIELAQAMSDFYEKGNPYTINDLINAAHLTHDTGISDLDPSKVRNEYYHPTIRTYEDKDGNEVEVKFDPAPDNPNIMQGAYTWYSLENPNIRGVVVNGKRFSLESAHELMRRFNYYYVKRALEMDMPELTPEMQGWNEYEPDITDAGEIKSPIGDIILPRELLENVSNALARQSSVEIPNTGGKKISSLKEFIYLIASGGAHTDNSGGFEIPELEGNNKFGIALASDDYYKVYKAKMLDHRDPTIGKVAKKNAFYNKNVLGSPYASGIAGLEGSTDLSNKFLNKNLFEFDGYINAVENGMKYVNEFTRRLAEISQWERAAYFRKTFWGDTKEWIQRIGNVVMLGSLVAAGLTGAPLFASIILGTMAFRIPTVVWLSKREAIFGARRNAALALQGEMTGKLGMYKDILGKPVTRLDEWMLTTTQSDNESKTEDIAKAGPPEGTYPSNDLAWKFANTVFGEKGLVGRMAGG